MTIAFAQSDSFMSLTEELCLATYCITYIRALTVLVHSIDMRTISGSSPDFPSPDDAASL